MSSNKTLIALSILAVILALLLVITRQMNHFVPTNWVTYTNTFYGYSFKHDSSVAIESGLRPIDGPNAGEDSSLNIYKINYAALQSQGLDTHTWDKFPRAGIFDVNYAQWFLSIDKPNIDLGNSSFQDYQKSCLKQTTNSGLTYFECGDNIKRAWTFFVYLTSKAKCNVFLGISYQQYGDSRKIIDKLAVKQIINSFTSLPQQATMKFPQNKEMFNFDQSPFSSVNCN
jgi:hypothetical protein